MKDVQFYKQSPGACDDDGSSMDPGWYWIKERDSYVAGMPPIPYGLSTGPFRTKREAMQAYRRNPQPRAAENEFRVATRTVG